MPDTNRPATYRPRLRHGLRATPIVIPLVESEDDWRQHRQRVFDDLQPVGYIEENLAHHCAEALWRLRRIARAEYDAIERDRYIDHTHERFNIALKKVLPQNAPGMSDMADFVKPPPEALPRSDRIHVILRYQSQQTRLFYRALHALQFLQDRRNRKTAPARP